MSSGRDDGDMRHLYLVISQFIDIDVKVSGTYEFFIGTVTIDVGSFNVTIKAGDLSSEDILSYQIGSKEGSIRFTGTPDPNIYNGRDILFLG